MPDEDVAATPPAIDLVIEGEQDYALESGTNTRTRGSLIGTVEVISGHKGTALSIYPEDQTVGIRCYVDEAQLRDVMDNFRSRPPSGFSAPSPSRSA